MHHLLLVQRDEDLCANPLPLPGYPSIDVAVIYLERLRLDAARFCFVVVVSDVIPLRLFSVKSLGQPQSFPFPLRAMLAHWRHQSLVPIIDISTARR
jgi:hypothetical protein